MIIEKTSLTIPKLKKASFIYLIILFIPLLLGNAGCNSKTTSYSFIVSMDKPDRHYFNVEFRIDNPKDDIVDIKLPVWSPGYYWIINYPANVINFTPKDENGAILPFEKVSKNTWRIKVRKAKSVIVNYDVFAFTQSVADPYLDDTHAYLQSPGVFMHVKDQLDFPVMIKINKPNGWRTISTGLDSLPGYPNTFVAKDFDELYDCPIYIGNQTVYSFDVQSIPHQIAVEKPENFDMNKLIPDLKKMVEAVAPICGNIPYKHYTFIIMGEGRGGLEHRNSQAVFSGGSYNPNDSAGYKRWLCFLTHEYFHLYNIKAIRPIALGPFDYDRENYTNMLWVSEGFTVYYEYLILNRAGLLSRDECLNLFSQNIANYENIPGHNYQSATQSSFDTWITFFNRNNNLSNTTISYYDKGCILGLLLDLNIRHLTKNSKTLDDVMKNLYQTYYIKEKRGFTDIEFKQVCEEVAGEPLSEIFSYASTTERIDYVKYLSRAGLDIDTVSKETSQTYLGLRIQDRNRKILITNVEFNSPAWKAGISPMDTIIMMNGKGISYDSFYSSLSGMRTGDTIRLTISRLNTKKDYNLGIEKKMEPSYCIHPLKDQDIIQKEILNSWLGYDQ